MKEKEPEEDIDTSYKVYEFAEVSSKVELRIINVPIQSYPDAFFLPPEAFEDRIGVPKPEPDVELVFSCKAGIRSDAAARLAKVAGYEK
ncbi:hypothetical protein ABW19_dt0205351 [Dactylella cylindrospora]|nr:hypothetical protein ABW19_dt0205351 [Dactylella cylindrospora]